MNTKMTRMQAIIECAALDLREVTFSVQEGRRALVRLDAALECAALDRAERRKVRALRH